MTKERNMMKKKKVEEDLETVCCMCGEAGDIGFPDDLFRCTNCRNRSQHSYCSNNYRRNAEAIEICDWCRCNEKYPSRSFHSRETITRHGGAGPTGKANGKTASPRITTRRYKLLKDVKC